MTRRVITRAALLALLPAGFACSSATSDDRRDAAPRVDALPVQVAATLRIHYPAGSSTLALRGSGGGLDWSRGAPLTRSADDVFTFHFAQESLAGPIEWKCLLDDTTWSLGPNYHLAPGDALDVYPHFRTTAGSVSTLIGDFTSAKLPGTHRAIYAYLPPTYLENERARFPVVYMHDGQNLFDPKLAFGGNPWKADKAMDTAAGSGRCGQLGPLCQNDGECAGAEVKRCDTFAEAVIIGIANTGDRIAEYSPVPDPMYGGGKGDAYLALVADELKPRVDALLRTLPDAAHTVMIGSSLGGLISLHAALRRHDVFGRIGALSPSTWWDETWIIGAVESAKQAKTPRVLRLYVDSGDSGASGDDQLNTGRLVRTLLDAGYVEGQDFRHLVAAGHQHSETYWSLRLPGALAFLLDRR